MGVVWYPHSPPPPWTRLYSLQNQAERGTNTKIDLTGRDRSERTAQRESLFNEFWRRKSDQWLGEIGFLRHKADLYKSVGVHWAGRSEEY